MVPSVFFGVLCLSPLAVMATDLSWVPDYVPWPAQQCIDAGLGYVGLCSITTEVSRQSPFYKRSPLCISLQCAQPRIFDGGYTMARRGRPKDGTICGFLKGCRAGRCVDLSPSKIPTQTGTSTVYDCRPPNVMPTRINNNNNQWPGPSRKIKQWND